jgi:hypothetical protein
MPSARISVLGARCTARRPQSPHSHLSRRGVNKTKGLLVPRRSSASSFSHSCFDPGQHLNTPPHAIRDSHSHAHVPVVSSLATIPVSLYRSHRPVSCRVCSLCISFVAVCTLSLCVVVFVAFKDVTVVIVPRLSVSVSVSVSVEDHCLCFLCSNVTMSDT